jgi:hypothetical protein
VGAVATGASAGFVFEDEEIEMLLSFLKVRR